MELLLAFLIAFGIVQPDTRYANSLTESQAEQLIVDNNLQKDFIIYGAEGDDF
jgi:hypothetical protein